MHLLHVMAAVDAGSYVSPWKALPILLLLLIWARLLTWMDKDAVDAHLPRLVINCGMIAGMIGGLLLFLLLPGYWLALGVFVAAMLSDVGVYLLMRHQRVGLGDLKDQLADFFHSLISRKPREPKAAEGEVQLIAKGGIPVGAPTEDDPIAPKYVAVQKLLTDPLRRRADTIAVMPSDGGASVRYAVDGVTYSGTSMSRDDAANAATYLKELAGLDLSEARKPQTGKIKCRYSGKSHELRVTTAGSTAGESVQILVDPTRQHEFTPDNVGFTPEQVQELGELVGSPNGIVLLSTPKGQGLTGLVYAVVRKHDAFLTHIHTIERDPPSELEGVTQNPLPAKASGTEEAKLTDWVTSQQPDVIAMSSVEDPRSAQSLAAFAAEGHRVYVGLRASSTFDAIRAWRKLVGDDKSALRDLCYVVNGRLVRKLCMACKVGYTADPETLRKLNMSPDKAGKLFQARTQPLRDPKGNPIVCEFCQDMRFVGRTGVFETFTIDDEIRQVISAGGSENQLKQLFRKQRRKYLQEQALARVEIGETSVQEVLRVLKPESSSSSSKSASPSAA